MQVELEARLLAAIRNSEDFRALQQWGISQEHFAHWRPVYHYIKQIIEEQGSVPRLRDLVQTFNLPTVVARDRKEFPYLLQEFRRALVAQSVQTLLDKSVQDYGEQPERLVDELMAGLAGLQRADSVHMSVTDHSMVSRLKTYEEKARALKSGQPTGIATGITFFDDVARLGWMPGELVGIVGRTYVGKSWLLLYFGLIAWQCGKRVLFISPEMAVDETEARFDALLFAKNDSPVETTSLYRGHVPTERHYALAAKTAQQERWITYSSSEQGGFSVAHIAALARRWHSDIVFIDGLPLLETGGRNRQLWENIKELSYGLKRVAVGLNVPILISHQATRTAHNVGKPPGLHEISYGDAFAQACDRVLALSKPRGKEDEPEQVLRITIQKFRKGQALPGGVDFHFAPEKGDIHELLSRDAGRPGRDRKPAATGPRARGAVPIP